MEIGPVFRALLHNRSRFWLITLEIALTLAVVVNCVAMIRDIRAEVHQDTGLALDEVLVVRSQPFGPEFQEEAFVQQSVRDDLAALRALPGVTAAGAIHQVPLSGGGSATGRRAVGSTELPATVPFYVVGPDIVAALGVELESGRDLVPEDWVDEDEATEGERGVDPDEPEEPRRRNVLVTRHLADRLFPDGDALGKTIEDDDGESLETIVGIIRRMDNSWPDSGIREHVMLIPGDPADSRRATYMVRADPVLLGELHPTVEKTLLAQNENRIVKLETLAEIKDETFLEQSAVARMLGAVSGLLVAVTGLGIVGLTSFSVTQRRRQIGTRRALGATRLAVLRWFLLENWLVTGIGLIAGIGLTYGLNWVLANFLEIERLDVGLLVAGMVFLWLVGLLAALLPALRGTLVSPVVATRSV